MQTVVIISSVPWHFSWQRHHDIAYGLAKKGYRVVYIDPLPKRWPNMSEGRRVLGRLLGSSKLGGKFVQNVPDGVVVISPMSFPDLKGFFSWINRVLFVPVLANKIRRITSQPLAVINYLPTASSLRLQKLLKAIINIYDCVVDWGNFPASQNLREVEEKMVMQADYILADSPYLLQKMMNIRQNNVYQVLPAVHYEDFRVCRQDHISNPEKILCAYFGGLREDNDLTLLRKVSYAYSLRVIGLVESKIKDFSLTTEFIGPVQYGDLPQHLADIDVLLLPYDAKKNYVKAIIPAKTFQCLATGKPTVVYGLDSLQKFKDFFCLADSHDDFISKIRQVILEDNKNKQTMRLEFARSNDWEKRIDFFDMLLQKADGK